jgi:hypothetical protein
MTATGIARVEDALLAFLRADVILAGIEGPPELGAPSRLLPHHVWIAPNVDSTSIEDLSNGTERLESFELEVVCFASVTGSDFVSARDASIALADRVSAIVQADADLSLGVGLYDVHVRGIRRDYIATDKSEGIAHTIRVGAQVILT